jgi:transcription elongation factor Elf1
MGKEIETLEKENDQLDQDLNKAVDLLEEKDKTIAKLNKTLAEMKTHNQEPMENKEKTFTCSECKQEKPQSELSRIFGSFSFCLDCSKKARKEAGKQKEIKPQPEEFTCHLCEKPKSEVPTKMKLDSTLTEYLVCQECRPLAKEFNEADLITDDL